MVDPTGTDSESDKPREEEPKKPTEGAGVTTSLQSTGDATSKTIREAILAGLTTLDARYLTPICIGAVALFFTGFLRSIDGPDGWAYVVALVIAVGGVVIPMFVYLFDLLTGRRT